MKYQQIVNFNSAIDSAELVAGRNPKYVEAISKMHF
jgi:hypothetical protein